MRICVFGAGATGGHFAARLARAGHEVSVVARGPHLAAMEANGLTLRTGGETLSARVRAAGSAEGMGPQDAVIVGVKATGLAAAAEGLAPLIGAGTLVVFPQNGMPWWYPIGLPDGGPPVPDLPIFRLAGPLLARMDAAQAVGGVIWSSNEIVEPGVIENRTPGRNRLELGAPGAPPPGLAGLRAALEAAGLASPAGDIRTAMWRKLLVNMSGSTIALATGNMASAARRDPRLSETFLRIMAEGLATAAAHGFPLPDIDPAAALAALPDHRPSILQDYELRRPMEVAEIVLAPAAFARAAGVPTPTLDAVAAIVARRAADRGLFDG